MNNVEIRWTSSARTHIGLVRKANEDAYLSASHLGLWAVADGMGGHSAGDVASRTVVESLADFRPDHDVAGNVDDLEQRLILANSKCLAMVEADAIAAGMGSTAALLYTSGNHCFVLWAGDSRIYHLRNHTLTQLTEDHSLVQEMYALGHLTAEEAANHPSGNVITRAIGATETLYVDMDYLYAEPGDRFLLCSDGLTRDLDDQEIGNMLQNPDLDQACAQLIHEALQRGGRDNTTVIVVEAQTQRLPAASNGFIHAANS